MPDAKTSEFIQGVAISLDAYAAKRAQSAGMPDAERPPVTRPWDSAGLFLARSLDLSALTTNVDLGVAGYEVAYVAPASASGGVLILNDSIALFPGQRVRAYFQSLRVRRGVAADGALLTSITSGAAYLVVHKSPDLQYQDFFPLVGGSGVVNATEAQSTTQAAPTGSTEGISLAGATHGWRFTVVAAAGQTLGGTGTFDIYYREPVSGLWGINPDLAVAVPATVSGLRTWTAPDFDTEVPVGRAAAIANGVGTSAGNLTVYYSAG